MEISVEYNWLLAICFFFVALVVFVELKGDFYISGAVALFGIFIVVHPYFEELNTKDYRTIAKLKNTYPEIQKEIDFALSDGKKTISKKSMRRYQSMGI